MSACTSTRAWGDWTRRFPRIVQAARKLPASSLLLDGEGVICDEIGLAIFERLHSKAYDQEVFLYAFDVLEHDGEDCRRLPLLARKARLATLLRPAANGIQVNEHLEGDGHAVFEHACQFGCEGIVAKRSDSPYRSGRSKSWIKVKTEKSHESQRFETAPETVSVS